MGRLDLSTKINLGTMGDSKCFFTFNTILASFGLGSSLRNLVFNQSDDIQLQAGTYIRYNQYSTDVKNCKMLYEKRFRYLGAGCKPEFLQSGMVMKNTRLIGSNTSHLSSPTQVEGTLHRPSSSSEDSLS